MGKKRPRSPADDDPLPSSSDIVSCSSGMEFVPEQKRLHSVDSGKHVKPVSSLQDTTGSSLKLLHGHTSASQHHQTLSRSAFFKRSRHYYAHQYSRRNSGHANSASTSRGKGTPPREEKISFKFAAQCSSDSGRHSEIKEKPFFRPPRIRSSILVTGATTSADPMKMLCGICQKPLRRKPVVTGSTLSSTEVSVVAVLDCGHLYHADCLEQKTSFEDRHDPPCPWCFGLLTKTEDSIEQA